MTFARRLCAICSYRLQADGPCLESTRPLIDSTDLPALDLTEPNLLDPTDPTTCTVCLGIFTSQFLRKVSAEVKRCLEVKSYDCDEFAVAIAIPISVQLRNKAAMKFSGKATALEPKLTMKHLISVLVCEESKFKYSARSDVQVTVSVDNNSEAIDSELFEDIFPSTPKAKKAKLTKKSDLCDYLSKIDSLTSYPPFTTPVDLPNFTISCLRSPLFIGGRYNKYSRYLNQTPWHLDGKRMSQTSVEELICGPLNHVICSKTQAMTSSGREDIDVRMLGRGRPFMISFEDPKRKRFRHEELAEFESKVNCSTEDIKVSKLVLLTNPALTQALRTAEETKRKHYTAICYCPEPVSEKLPKLDIFKSQKLRIRQKTPLRVMHRRSIATRDRIIHEMRYISIDENHFQLFLVTQAGTYVKEFVHSDLGRTEPSLDDLLGVTEVDILELDVQDVEMEWP